MIVEPRLRAAAFRGLHQGPDLLVLPGVWDVASARIFAGEGFPALGTTSAGIAWTLGYAVGQHAPWELFRDASLRIARAVSTPVTVDVEAGFAEKPSDVRERVRELIEAGVCGINLEDGVAGGCLGDPSHTEDSIRAIRDLCAALRFPLFVNARTDVYLAGLADASKRLSETISRGQRYARAGADGFFVPGMTEPAEIRAVVAEVPLPLNVYALPGVPTACELRDLGVRRVSLGCGPLQALLARSRRMAQDLRTHGDWSCFTTDWLSYEDAMALVA